MKKIILFPAVFLLVTAVLGQGRSTAITGAWETDALKKQTTMICSEKFFAVSIYDTSAKQFIETHGGSYRLQDGEWIGRIEFHSMNPELVGKEIRMKARLSGDVFTIEDPSGNVEWRRVDNGTPGALAGAWLITGRVRNGEMSPMTPGARRTMKILSGTRFQWIAYNVDTKQFSGTGGGTYTTRKGKYTENIEFFSRDNSRVGASLTFDYAIEDGKWRHTGSSSRGEPIDEVWTQREKTGL